ncbi:hypothetical protein ACFOGJ_16180 [Marinibaculum pumilum]|uniref:Uncharacterized protein n=1 Tax=Marinibaculum pumilum TaxID=1766165 RepID=A0ABV7L2D6_9PROT
MTTYVLRAGKLVEKAKASPRTEKAGAFSYMPDIEPFRAPSRRGEILSSRKHVRDFERAYECRQVGNDMDPTKPRY